MNIDIKKNFCLIKPIKDNEHFKLGDKDIKIGKTKEGLDYNEGEHSVRRGYLIELPEKIEYSEAGCPWQNDSRPDINDIVYFDYLTGMNCDTYKGLLIMPYNSLILALNDNMDVSTIKMLNGVILAQNLQKERSELDIKDTFYQDGFKIKKTGEPNLNYLDGTIDDEGVIQGSKVLTKFSNYPSLEAQHQLRLDGEYYVYFKRNTVMAIL